MSKKNEKLEKFVELVKEGSHPEVEEERKSEPKIIAIRVNDLDRMIVLLAGEKVKRSNAELQALALKLNQVDAELKALSAAEKDVLRQIWSKYELGPEDTFDDKTGIITRKGQPSKDGSLAT